MIDIDFEASIDALSDEDIDALLDQVSPGHRDADIIEDLDERWNDATWCMTHRDEIHRSTRAKQAREKRRAAQ